MKKLIIGIGALLMLAGCNSDEEYQSNINKGLEAVAEDNFGKAEALFEIALENKPKDESAKAYLDQVVYIQEAVQAQQDEEIEAAIEALEKAINIKAGSKVIGAKAEEQKEEIEALKESNEKLQALLEEAENLHNVSKYDESQKVIDSLLAQDVTSTIKQAAEMLKEKNNVAKQKQEAQIAAKKKAEAANVSDPYAWNPGVQAKFEQEMVNNGYVDSIDTIRYEKAGVYNNEGHYAVYGVFDGQEFRIVNVNAKTGDYHG